MPRTSAIRRWHDSFELRTFCHCKFAERTGCAEGRENPDVLEDWRRLPQARRDDSTMPRWEHLELCNGWLCGGLLPGFRDWVEVFAGFKIKLTLSQRSQSRRRSRTPLLLSGPREERRHGRAECQGPWRSSSLPFLGHRNRRCRLRGRAGVDQFPLPKPLGVSEEVAS